MTLLNRLRPWFIVAAIVLIVFAVIATANATTGSLFGVLAVSWAYAALLSFFVYVAIGWDERRSTP
jgi:hypothetical protein